ncbi:MAG: hypothetical protein KatS3mg077_1193 [Candidatus Binatia bacterium]|nr:MAG: hypothetical protein KatS3mg077_1193 [Candidatus Binatia bacterium]
MMKARSATNCLEHLRPNVRHTLVVSAIWIVPWLARMITSMLALALGTVFSKFGLFLSTMALITFAPRMLR